MLPQVPLGVASRLAQTNKLGNLIPIWSPQGRHSIKYFLYTGILPNRNNVNMNNVNYLFKLQSYETGLNLKILILDNNKTVDNNNNKTTRCEI